MTETPEDKAARDKAAIEAMRNAKSNMSSALDRVSILERALSDAISALRTAKEDISPKVYTYPFSSSERQTVHARIDASIANLSKVL
jgi:hypothetical protein